MTGLLTEGGENVGIVRAALGAEVSTCLIPCMMLVLIGLERVGKEFDC